MMKLRNADLSRSQLRSGASLVFFLVGLSKQPSSQQRGAGGILIICAEWLQDCIGRSIIIPADLVEDPDDD